tara:strand:- start:778 stop:1017 length:240 start_codon:yes stop_codon:yes gene_type:complete
MSPKRPKNILDISIRDFFLKWKNANLNLYKEINIEISQKNDGYTTITNIKNIVNSDYNMLFIGIDLLILTFLLMLLYVN